MASSESAANTLAMSAESFHELDPDGDVLLILHSRLCQPNQVKQKMQSEGLANTDPNALVLFSKMMGRYFERSYE